jgi:proteic killer suppression protein
VIETFGNKLAEGLFDDSYSNDTRRFPNSLRKIARRKLHYLHDAVTLEDLRVPPGNRLESLKGTFKGFYSIRINDQWRLVFKWQNGQALEVRILDYH